MNNRFRALGFLLAFSLPLGFSAPAAAYPIMCGVAMSVVENSSNSVCDYGATSACRLYSWAAYYLSDNC